LAVALLLGPGEVPAPTIEVPIQRPIEGPAPLQESTPASEPGIELATEPGIEFATEPSEAELDPESATADVAAEPGGPTPGSAPPDGWGFITTGAILMPSAALLSWVLLAQAPDRSERIAVLATGGVIELMAIGGLSMGLYRQFKLKRWTLAYRVVARPQGGG